MDAWPITLQQKLNVAGFSHTLGKTTARTEMDVGPAKVRSRFTDAIDLYSCSINIDFAEYSTFVSFFKTTLNSGVAQFLFVDPFTLTENAFRFAEEPTITPLGGRYFQVSMVWEKIPT